MIHAFFDRLAAIFKRPAVWQIVPPQDYRDRMAQEGAPATPPGGYPVTDHGGSILKAPKLALVYLGAWWGDTAKLEQFAGDLMTAGYLTPLSIYGVTGPFTYLGAFQGPAVPAGTVTDAFLQGTLSNLVANKTVPAPDADTLYALILPSGVTVSEGGSDSCAAFCGYHDAIQATGNGQPATGDGGGPLPDASSPLPVYYSVQPASDCSGCNMGDPFAAFTMLLSHEVAEAASDAVPGQGWYNDQTGMEVSDEWAWIPETYGPWTVQGYQVNGTGNDFGPYTPQTNPNANPNPQPQPQPQPGGGITQAQVDAGFADAMGQIQQAITAEPAEAWWFQYGATWVDWAQSVVDADLQTPGTSSRGPSRDADSMRSPRSEQIASAHGARARGGRDPAGADTGDQPRPGCLPARRFGRGKWARRGPRARG